MPRGGERKVLFRGKSVWTESARMATSQKSPVEAAQLRVFQEGQAPSMRHDFQLAAPVAPEVTRGRSK